MSRSMKFVSDLVLGFYHLSHVMRKPDFAYAKTKAQISFAVTAKLISALDNTIINFKLLAICCSCTCQFVSDLV